MKDILPKPVIYKRSGKWCVKPPKHVYVTSAFYESYRWKRAQQWCEYANLLSGVLKFGRSIDLARGTLILHHDKHPLLKGLDYNVVLDFSQGLG